ncbi:uncharacterized protein LOC130827928 [Amaranthus tricolor]|uniref:uncharacterized protein LOC130827928 n=1 Tax=Amaranthus tricolor TaxID=29722 RepID=UPI00258D0891|nr:uncharacterized protein LOC130827928 [Amaranthus tricolor]
MASSLSRRIVSMVKITPSTTPSHWTESLTRMVPNLVSGLSFSTTKDESKPKENDAINNTTPVEEEIVNVDNDEEDDDGEYVNKETGEIGGPKDDNVLVGCISLSFLNVSETTRFMVKIPLEMKQP